jgi:hypothetical protein
MVCDYVGSRRSSQAGESHLRVRDGVLDVIKAKQHFSPLRHPGRRALHLELQPAMLVLALR